MGRAVTLWKISEDERAATYEYGVSRKQAGKLVVDKLTFEIDIISPVIGSTKKADLSYHSGFFMALIKQCFEKGEYPQVKSLCS